jgi:hypothetical protein
MSEITDCYIAVDAMQPRQALLQTYAPDGKLGTYTGEIHTHLTTDGGATWLDTGGANSVGISPLAQAPDGALLATTPDPSIGEALTLLRAAPGQSAWESLGEIPPGANWTSVQAPGASSLVQLAPGATSKLWRSTDHCLYRDISLML